MAVKPWRASSPRPLLHFMEEREKAVERHRFIPNSTPESSLIGTQILKRAIALLRCPRPRGAGGTNGARFHPPPHSFRRLWIGTAQRVTSVPFRRSGLTLAPRRVGRAVLCPPRLPTRVTLCPGTARTEWRALPNSDSAREVTGPWVDQSRFIHSSFIGMYPVCSCC